MSSPRPRRLPTSARAARRRHAGLRLGQVFALVGQSASLHARLWAVPVSPTVGDGWMLSAIGEGWVGFSRDDAWSCYHLGLFMRDADAGDAEALP